jgi:FkbM family methyltransferase
MKSYSQLKQDLNIISFFNNKNDMYFIDIGANDGKTLSNTFLLEKQYNWKGICSEPLPRAFKQLIKCRSVACDNNAVFSKSGLSLEFSESNLLSGITNFIDKYEDVKKGNQIIVKTITLQSLLDNYKAPKIIQYFSLDTEGTELEILKSVDFSTYTFLYINLEHNHVEPRRSEMRTLLLNNGYLYKGENKWDDDYIHESTVIGTYYYQQDYTKPIVIKRHNNDFSVSSTYWNDDTGTFQNGFLNWKRLGNGKIFYTHIDYGNGNIWHRDNRLDRYFCDFFINKQINNEKGINFKKRFIDILSDPNNLLIKRVKNAGKIIDDNYVIMHNGIKVSKNGYYGSFSKCLTLNYGCHEPAEERMFQEVLLDIQDNATMIELGSYWSFYSIWFNKRIKNAKNYCIEPDSNNMEVGIRNCNLNNVKVDFTQGFIGNNNIKISNFVLEKNIDYIDILHSDIQGYELQLLEDIIPLLNENKIKYIFVSTHSNTLHYDCLELLKKCNYRIIASADFEKETFCFDGIIVACPEDNLTIKHTSLGCRKTTQLRNKPYKVDYFL